MILKSVLAALGIAALLVAPVSTATKTAYDFSFMSIDGGPLPLARYRGKAILIVNTASFCGFTHQYGDLQKIWQQYKSRGLIVLGVPSNDFGNQEPGTRAQIKQFCEVNFNIDFPLADKVVVKGPKAHPFYRWARQTLGSAAAPRWNFHKYLVSRDGRLIAWFPSQTKPTSKRFVQAIEKALTPAKTN